MVLGASGVDRFGGEAVEGPVAVAQPRRSGMSGRAWRSVLATLLLAILVVAPLAATPREASAGQRGMIVGDGNPLFSRPDPNSGVRLYVEHGHWVDVLSGPHNGMWEIRYYGTDGYIYTDKVELEGGGGGGVGGGSSNSNSGGGGGGGAEHWIIVDRSDASVNLIIGKETIATYWASLGYDGSAYGFYATALGTHYVTEMNAALTWNRYSGRYITHWVEFDPERDNGFHSYLKYGNGEVTPNGDGPTGGCVAMSNGAAGHVYDFAYVGMRVVVRW